MVQLSQKKVRYAVMGLGHIAQAAVIPAFKNAKANSELVALISDDPEKLKKVGKQYKVAPENCFHYDQYPDCLEQAGVDVVYVCLPNHLHADASIKAMERGVHVLCEKPLAINVEECDRMIRASEEYGVHLMTAYRLHFEKANLEALRIAHKQMGELRIFNSVFTFQVKDPENIRLTDTPHGGGPVWDIGVYCINAARSLFKDEPIEVSAFVENNGEARFSNTHEMISVMMRFPKNRLATFVCGFGSDSCATYDLIGTKGRLRLEKAYEYATSREVLFYKDDKTTKTKYKKADQFSAELLYFSDCVLKNRKPEPSGEEGRADVRVIQAIMESLIVEAPVRLFEEEEITVSHPRPSQLIERPGIPEPRTVNVQSASS